MEGVKAMEERWKTYLQSGGKEVVKFILFSIAAGGYAMLMLLILSFISISIIPFTLSKIISISLVIMIIADIIYIIRRGSVWRKENQ